MQSVFKPPRGTLLNRTHPLARGLVGAWILNELTGETLFDISGHGCLMTMVANAPRWAAGHLNFDTGVEYAQNASVQPHLSFGDNPFSVTGALRPRTRA